MILGPRAKKEIFGHHGMWKEVPSQEPLCRSAVSMHPHPPSERREGGWEARARCSPVPSPALVPFLHPEVAAWRRAP